MRSVLALTALLPTDFCLRAQQPSDLNTLVAPIAETISRSGKHKVCVLPLRGPDNKPAELGVWLAKQISTRLAASVSGLEIIDTSSWPIPPPDGSVAVYASEDSGVLKKLEKKAGVEIIVSGSYSSLKNALGISLYAHPFGKDKTISSIQGLLSLTAEMPAPPRETASDQTNEKIPRAGVGGVSIPRCIHCPDPYYPEAEKSHPRNGTATLKFVIGVDGRAHQIQVVRATSPNFAAAAVNAAREFRFEPAKGPDGRYVQVFVNYELTFRLF
ncbi:MAG TPA: TonB family protein [Candidatus Acidoferrales bacterium]|nr:TonB family protein [Candidatus Acidoferrales bacterium]